MSTSTTNQLPAGEVPDIVIITGMSGAGRTEALKNFEDLGYYAIDNLPPAMLLQLAELVGINTGVGRHLAVVCDLRSQGLFDELTATLGQLKDHELSYALVFLDSDDETLRRRYALSRRKNPLAFEGEATIDAIRRERRALEEARHLADVVIDTSHTSSKELRHRLHTLFSELTEQQLMEVQVFSFGFKYGMPQEADLMIDVRFLPNPYWDPEMRTLTGTDERVQRFVLDHPQTKAFLDAWFNLLDAVMPGYVAEGKSRLSIGVGCSGGQHRSVTLATATADYLRAEGYRTTLVHRDLPRAQTNHKG